MALKLVPPAEPPEESPRRKVARGLAAKSPAYMLICRRCSGAEFIETVTGVEVKGGKHRLGTKTKLCLACLMKGQRVEAL